MLPELLRSHRGRYVAVHDGRLVDEGEDKIALALEAYQKFGYVPIGFGATAWCVWAATRAGRSSSKRCGLGGD